jgi:hypothetical protein
MAIDASAGRNLVERIHGIQVVVRELTYPGDELQPRPELARTDVEALTRVRQLLVDASTKVDPAQDPGPDWETAMSLLQGASALLESLDTTGLPAEAASQRDEAIRGIRELGV